MSNTEKHFLSPDELLAEFGFGLKWQAKWRASKMGAARIPYIKLGGYVRYSRQQIEQWILKHSIVSEE